MDQKKMIVAIALACCLPGMAQKRAFNIEDIYRIKSAYGPVVSPVGKLAYTLSFSNLKTQKNVSDIYLNGQIFIADSTSSSPVWSRDAKSIFYTSDKSGTPQIYRKYISTGRVEKLIDYKLGIQGAVVSPDNNLIAFAAEVLPNIVDIDGSANKKANDLKAENPVQAHITDHLLYRHWTQYQDGHYWHIIIYNIADKSYTDVTPGNFHSPVFSPSGPDGFVFSPDSRELCYMSNHTEHPEANTNCDLWIVPVTGGVPKDITEENVAWDGSPQYSPDGRYIAYRMQEVPGYESDRFRLALYDRKTGRKSILTEAFDNWVDDYKWAENSKSIYFLGEVRGVEPLYTVNIKNKKIVQLIGDRAIGSFDVDKQGTVYYTYSTTGKPSAIYKMQKGKEIQITHYNDALEAEVDIRPSEAMWIKGAKGDSVEFFIVKPHGFDPSKKYPLIINVHGGPQMQWMNSFRADWQVYPGAGYVVAYPNPHGSTGYGQRFTRDISGNWGSYPYQDVMKMTDKLASLNYVDSTRMGAMGWSYGGYFMNWLQAKTKRFKCLASMMGLYDLKSMWGATEELWFPDFDLQGKPWNSDCYKKWSPSEYVSNFATPTLIITGERDYRVPYTQSLQYFTTLQTLNIPSRLIVLKNDGHWPSGLSSMPLYYNAHLEWFHKYLGGDPAPWNSEKLVSGEEKY
jgi:dipeptidyl aminopeptidase/acylaminoacyl peptidase